MSFDYTVSEDELEEDQNTQSLLRPYNGPVELVDLKFDDDPETFGDNDVIVFTFKALSDDHIGQTFEHIEWKPDEEDFGENPDTDDNGATDFQIQMHRLIHMLSRLLDTDKETIRKKVVLFQGDTLSEAWSNLGLRVQEALDKFGVTDDTVEARAYASVNDDGYVNVKFEKYPNFIRVVGEDPKMEFSSWEQQQNQEAIRVLDSDPDDSDEFEDDDDDFDFDVDDTDF